MKFLYDLAPIVLRVTLLDYLNKALKSNEPVKFKIDESKLFGAFDCSDGYPQIWLARKHAELQLREVQEVLDLLSLKWINLTKIEKAGQLWFLVACEN